MYFDLPTAGGAGGVTFYRGTLSGSSVIISPVGTVPAANPLNAVLDGASCAFIPFGFPGTVASIDTAFRCAGAAPTTLTVTGTAPFTWAVLSGSATLAPSPTGSSVTVTPTATSRILVSGSPSACGLVFTDTVTLIVPTATLDAGPAKSYLNCGNTTTTLTGSLTGTTAGVTYALAWSPAAYVVSGGSTLTPTVNAPLTTLFTLAATTPAAQGGCTFSDTTRLTVAPAAAPFTLDASRDSVFCSPVPASYFLYATPSVAAPYYSYTWSGGPLSTAANIALPRPVTSTPGTFTYFVEVRDTFGCHLRRDTVRLTYHNLSATLSPAAAPFCPGDTIVLRAQGSPGPTASGAAPRWAYTWSPTTALSCATCSTTVARPTATTTYGVTVRDSVSGCAFYRSAVLTSFRFLDSFTAGPDVTTRVEPGRGTAPFTLLGRAPVAASLLGWSPAEPLDQPFAATTNGRVDSTTAFVLTAFNGPCQSRDTAIVFVVGCAGLAMPNVFSPNGDTRNEVFTLADAAGAAAAQITLRELRIYNRWGTLVHSEAGGGSGGGTGAGTSIMRGWDGKLNGEAQPAGVYVWQLEGECRDRATGERTPFEQKGNVTLVR